MLKVKKNTKIYIACPSNVATGGPELLHQLAYNLRNVLGIDSYMYYYDFSRNIYKSPVHPEYEHYKVPYIINKNEIEDIKDNILIVPEILSACEILTYFSNLQKVIWFLSVDNYYLSRLKTYDFFLKRLLNKFSKKFWKYPIFDIRIDKIMDRIKKDTLIRDSVDLYLTNSYRGLEFFKKYNLTPYAYLSEYLNDTFLIESEKVDLSNKKNIVLYNPKKGLVFTRKIIKFVYKNKIAIKFIPLQNMTRKEVIDIFKKSKVYIDFGNHPGKDRMPREAAILMNCVITGRRGSAAYKEDVPIPEKYKFEDKKENIPKIVDTILDCFENFEERIKEFEYYRNVIKNEKQKFIEDLKKIFVLKEE